MKAALILSFVSISLTTLSSAYASTPKTHVSCEVAPGEGLSIGEMQAALAGDRVHFQSFLGAMMDGSWRLETGTVKPISPASQKRLRALVAEITPDSVSERVELLVHLLGPNDMVLNGLNYESEAPEFAYDLVTQMILPNDLFQEQAVLDHFLHSLYQIKNHSMVATLSEAQKAEIANKRKEALIELRRVAPGLSGRLLGLPGKQAREALASGFRVSSPERFEIVRKSLGHDADGIIGQLPSGVSPNEFASALLVSLSQRGTLPQLVQIADYMLAHE